MNALQLLSFVVAALIALIAFRAKVGPDRTRMGVLSARMFGVGFVLWTLLLTFARLPLPWRFYSFFIIFCIAIAPLVWEKIRPLNSRDDG